MHSLPNKTEKLAKFSLFYLLLKLVQKTISDNVLYNQICIKRSPLGQRKNGFLRHVTSYKRFNSYEIFCDRTRKRLPFNTDPGSYKFTIRTKHKRTKNANETNEKRTNASHERYKKRTIHETNARYTMWTHDTRNERTIQERTNEMKRMNYTGNSNERTHDTRNERTTHERTNHWSVNIYYPMTNDPDSIEVQYSIVLLCERLLCKLVWLTNLIFYTQLIYINDKLVSKVIG